MKDSEIQISNMEKGWGVQTQMERAAVETDATKRQTTDELMMGGQRRRKTRKRGKKWSD